MTKGARAEPSCRPGEPDAAFTNLLDHIATELAEEYVRLMEAATGENPERMGFRAEAGSQR